jgi:hypothetical protein
MSELETNAMILAPRAPLAAASIQPTTLARVENLLAKYSLFGRVNSVESNETAVCAQAELKALLNEIESARKVTVAPWLEMQRRINAAARGPQDQLEQEIGRIAALTKPWLEAERRRKADEELAQMRELQRIEAARAAEVERLAREQREREEAAQRQAQEAQRLVEAAAAEARRLFAEATNKADREAAEIARAEAQRLTESARLAAAQAEESARVDRERIAAAVEVVNDQAGAAAYLSSRPIERTIPKGQSGQRDWEVEVTNPYELAKQRPDLVEIKPLIGKIKAALRDLDPGMTLPGVRATETVCTTVRAKRQRGTIEA